MREIEKIITAHPKYDKRYIDNTEIINMLKNAYNLGLQDAVDNAELLVSPYDMESWNKKSLKDEDLLEYFLEDEEGNCLRDGFEVEVDKESILKLKL